MVTDHTAAALPRRVTPLVEARFALDGGAMFGIIPRPLWERTNPPDESNRIAMTCRCLLVELGDGRHALVDVGIGDGWSDRERDIYKIHDQDPALHQALAAHDLTPEDIDEVILTHLHFDHAGGLTRAGDDGQRRPCFPNARHWVQRRNWSWAHHPSARDGGSYRVEDFDFLGTGDGPELVLVDGIDEILPGIEVLPCHGHTFGMQVVKIHTQDNDTYVHLADLVPTTSHLRDPYVMGYDLQPLKTVEEKREILYHASRQGWILCFEHDPQTPLARIEVDERGRPSAVPVS